jgi:hypothetical protein
MVLKTFINVFFIHLIKLVGAFEFDKENVQRVEWEECDIFKCATIKVPLNHLDKKSEFIELKMTKSLAKVQPAEKTLFLDIGSRHKNHSDTLKYHGRKISKILKEKVDLILVEFRAVRQIACPKLKHNLGKSPSESEMRNFDEFTKFKITSCQEESGQGLEYMSTARAARDLDIVREALGMESLNFWGIRHGGILGLTYANMFPQRVGQIILDAVPNVKYYAKHPLDFAIDLAKRRHKVLIEATNACDKTIECPVHTQGIFKTETR